MAVFSKPSYRLTTTVRVTRLGNGSEGRRVSFGPMFWNIAPFDFVYNKKYESFTGLFALFVLLLNSGLLLGTVSMIGKHSWKRRK